MVHKMNEPMSRRRFLRVAGTGVLTLGLTSPFFLGCGPKDVEKVITGLTKLATLINNYRNQKGLAAIPISPAMTTVALKHVIDLNTYHPDKACAGNSNNPNDWKTHSWSKHGKWKGGCYDRNNSSTWPVMWNKPKEIAKYPEYGYEIAHWWGYNATAQDALDSWKKSPPHKDVILNKGIWQSYTWKALGAAVSGNYACAWFGVAVG